MYGCLCKAVCFNIKPLYYSKATTYFVAILAGSVTTKKEYAQIYRNPFAQFNLANIFEPSRYVWRPVAFTIELPCVGDPLSWPVARTYGARELLLDFQTGE